MPRHRWARANKHESNPSLKALRSLPRVSGRPALPVRSDSPGRLVFAGEGHPTRTRRQQPRRQVQRRLQLSSLVAVGTLSSSQSGSFRTADAQPARTLQQHGRRVRDRHGHAFGAAAGLCCAALNRRLYALHRWIAALALIQLAIWLGTGLFFASFPIERVRGEARGEATPLMPDDATGLLNASTALAIATASGVRSVRALELRRAAEGPVYVVRGRDERIRIDARTGALLDVTRDEAEVIARLDQGGIPATNAELVEGSAPIDYRERPLPAWRVRLADEARTDVWIDARTGDVTARRNDLWRTYDFLWSLHIMDYRARERFHHPLIIVVASLAAFTVVSGVVLWAVRIVRRVRRRHAALP